VALRKTRGLVAAGASVTVVAPEILPDFFDLPVRVAKRAFEPLDVQGSTLVFAATNIREVNAAIARECRRSGIWVNVADRREECAFLVPALVSTESAEVAISTGGRDPRMAADLRRRIEAFLRAPQVKSD
jgi:siroheme synthase-like protein